MGNSKEDLVEQIEDTRKKLNTSIDLREDYQETYQISIELDKLIEQYIVAGY